MSQAIEHLEPQLAPMAPATDSHMPGPREQISGFTFALLLLSPELTIREVNPAAEHLIGRSSRRLMGRNVFDVIDFGASRMGERLQGDESQLIARNLVLHVGPRALSVDMTVSPLSSHPGWRVVTLSEAGQAERLGEDERAGALRGPAVLAHEIKNPLSAIRGAAQLLARKVGEGERTLTSLITDEVDRIASLVDRMQRLGRERPSLRGHATSTRHSPGLCYGACRVFDAAGAGRGIRSLAASGHGERRRFGADFGQFAVECARCMRKR